MRGTVPGLPSPFPLGAMLPAVFQEDDFVQRWTGALDEVLAPVIWALDNLPTYFDPELAPADFVAWLATWVGVELDETWPEAARREMVSRAIELFRIRGTVEGLRRHVAIYAGAEPEITDSGGCTWSEVAGGRLPGHGRPGLVITLRVPDPDALDRRRIDRIITASKPAHLPHRLEVVPA